MAILSSKQLIFGCINETKFRYKWSITCNTQESCLYESSTFATFEKDSYSFNWKMLFYRDTFFADNVHKISIKLISAAPPEGHVSIQIQCFIKNLGLDKPVFNAEFNSHAKLPVIKTAQVMTGNEAINNIFRRNNYRRRYDNSIQELEFLVELQINRREKADTNVDKLADDLEKLLKCELMSDVKILVGEREFKAHIAILAARSPVFVSMFTHEMLEKNTKKVEILDTEEETFDLLLQFIYTGKLTNTENVNWNQLLIAADKYDIKDLKNICLINVHKSITVDNVIDTLQCAILKNFDDLKEEAIDFIIAYKKEIIKTDTYVRMVKHQRDILDLIFRKIAETDE